MYGEHAHPYINIAGYINIYWLNLHRRRPCWQFCRAHSGQRAAYSVSSTVYCGKTAPKAICHLLLPELVVDSDHLRIHGNVNLHTTGDPRALFPPHCVCKPLRECHPLTKWQSKCKAQRKVTWKRRPVTLRDLSFITQQWKKQQQDFQRNMLRKKWKSSVDIPHQM